MDIKTVTHFHMFSGSGGGAKGFNESDARVGSMKAKFICLGGIDVDPRAIEDFTNLTGVKGTLLDLFSRDQYTRFHGAEPPADWREATPTDIKNAAGNNRPNIVFTSSPCKGYSGLLAASKARNDKYQALNELTLRGFFLSLEAWKNDPPEFFIMENVPRIQSRGSHLLDQIEALLESYGYAVARTTHDCGEIGGLAQSRRRFLLVARHREKVPPFLYEPQVRPILPVGRLLERMPLPDDPNSGPMHQLPRLQWKTWVRLAFVKADSDWRSLHNYQSTAGKLSDYLIMPERYGYSGILGVNSWDNHAPAISARSSPSTGKYSVADPRLPFSPFLGFYKITEKKGVPNILQHQYLVSDPRSGINRKSGDNYSSTKHYGVLSWSKNCGAIASASRHDNGAWSVADPRHFEMPITKNRIPDESERLVANILSLDNTWHRPFTTLELAVLQGLIEPEDHITLSGSNHTSWRERIGNMVPPKAAKAIGSLIGETLLLAWSGETFVLSSTPIWVRNVAAATSLQMPPKEL